MYKSICIHRGRFTDTTLVDSHTSKSFRLQFADIKVDLHTKTSFAYMSKFELFLYIANITQGELRVKVSKETVVLGLWG